MSTTPSTWLEYHQPLHNFNWSQSTHGRTTWRHRKWWVWLGALMRFKMCDDTFIKTKKKNILIVTWKTSSIFPHRVHTSFTLHQFFFWAKTWLNIPFKFFHFIYCLFLKMVSHVNKGPIKVIQLKGQSHSRNEMQIYMVEPTNGLWECFKWGITCKWRVGSLGSPMR